MIIKKLYNCKLLVGILIQVRDDFSNPNALTRETLDILDVLDKWISRLSNIRPPLIDQSSVDNLKQELLTYDIRLIERELDKCVSSTYVENLKVN